jgi:hypothetical protein
VSAGGAKLDDYRSIARSEEQVLAALDELAGAGREICGYPPEVSSPHDRSWHLLKLSGGPRGPPRGRVVRWSNQAGSWALQRPMRTESLCGSCTVAVLQE